jgi:RNA-directed DNA polymerase
MSKAKPFSISKRLVMAAYQKVRSNKGSAGVDEVSMNEFDKDYRNHLYKVWNRMSSGSYIPPPVKLIEIPKKGGGLRPLGIPTVADRIAQSVVRGLLEPTLEPLFIKDSYGYRPGKSAKQAVERVRQLCWKQSWVIDLDIKGFFDNIPPSSADEGSKKALRNKVDTTIHRKMAGGTTTVTGWNTSSKNQGSSSRFCYWATAC